MQYANLSGSVRWSGGTIVLRKGQSIDDAHPLLAERPDLFDDQEPGAEIGGRVQTNMQRPGENRMERGPARPVIQQAPPRVTPDGE